MNNKIHIVPHEGEWAVRMTGAQEPAKVVETQEEAIKKAMDLAHHEGVDIVVHRRDGSFRNVINYETVERRLAETEADHRALAWALFAAGALTALTVYFITQRPADTRRLMRRIDEQRPDWLRRD